MSEATGSKSRPIVFVVNSEDAFLLAVGTLLEEEGYRAVTMHISDATFDIALAIQPTILMIDFLHDDPRAWILLDAFDADERTRKIPLLATSTDDALLAQVRERKQHRPHIEMLIKPLNLDELIDAVHKLNGGSPSTA